MPRSLDELIAHGDQLAEEFVDVDRSLFVEPTPESKIRLAAMRRSGAERQLRDAVLAGRRAKLSWEIIGQMLGTTGEAARKRYGKLDEGQPLEDATAAPLRRKIAGGVAVAETRAESEAIAREVIRTMRSLHRPRVAGERPVPADRPTY